MTQRLDHALLLARTARNLRPVQLAHRVRLRAQRLPSSWPIAASIIARMPAGSQQPVGWPASFTPLDLKLPEGCPAPEDNAQGRFAFLNDERDLGQPVDWAQPGPSRLWTYHLHYMEWAWSFATHPDRAWARSAFARLWSTWDASAPFGRGDAWSPYVASLRAWVLCGVYSSLIAGSGVQPAVDASLRRHARFLRWHVEHDVGGNHLVKNLKALIGLGVFLGDARLVARSSEQLQRQLAVQVLADGGHYERSPSYHCQVLGDLIDVAGLLATSERPAIPGLDRAVEAMRQWLGLMLLPDGDVPLFNDSVLVGRLRLDALRPGPAAVERLTVLPQSGYVVMRPDEHMHLVADIGDPCPPDLPAHAQADCLSFELAVGGRRVVVDAGTSTYAAGPERAYERSTAAHNTVTIDGADQTEVWSVFRAARLARARIERADDDGHTITVTGSHDGYRRLPGHPVHRRTWTASPTAVTITDEVLGTGNHTIESHVRFSAPGAGTAAWAEPADVQVTDCPARHATGFGRFHDGRLVTATWRGRAPATFRMDLHLEGEVLQGSGDGTGTEQALKGTG